MSVLFLSSLASLYSDLAIVLNITFSLHTNIVKINTDKPLYINPEGIKNGDGTNSEFFRIPTTSRLVLPMV